VDYRDLAIATCVPGRYPSPDRAREYEIAARIRADTIGSEVKITRNRLVTFRELITLAELEGRTVGAQYVGFCNGDVAPLECYTLPLEGYGPEHWEVWALLRYEWCQAIGGWRADWQPPTALGTSQDVWIWEAGRLEWLMAHHEHEPFWRVKVGVMRCDNVFAAGLGRLGVTVRNPVYGSRWAHYHVRPYGEHPGRAGLREVGDGSPVSPIGLQCHPERFQPRDRPW